MEDRKDNYCSASSEIGTAIHQLSMASCDARHAFATGDEFTIWRKSALQNIESAETWLSKAKANLSLDHDNNTKRTEGAV